MEEQEAKKKALEDQIALEVAMAEKRKQEEEAKI